ncbi:uncharacterized protein LOC125228374 isoform X2 [Leguminivora glycinivorella]|uniref:uncharacterized protein LOC125228374 isoform X2 n=1 Tax=Leguminivora glycinivorella TaxID=1035111 RepID=UPI00200C3658|nr:uncharacterized protein LOC125228374 isoform X2 [Leguminivora glycinivorella]
MVCCVVQSCPNRSIVKNATQSLSYFRPTTHRLEDWSKSLGMELKISDSICHHHFKAEHINMYSEFKIKGEVKYIRLERKTLKKEALPTVEHQFIPPQVEANIIHLHESFESVPNHSPKEQLKQCIPKTRKSHKEGDLPTIEHIPLPEHQVEANNIDLHESFESLPNHSPNEQQEQNQADQHELSEDQKSSDIIMDYEMIEHHLADPLLIQEEVDDEEDTNVKINSIEIDDDEDTTNVKINPIEIFKSKFQASSLLPPYWLHIENPNGIEFMRMDPRTQQIKHHIRLNNDLSVTVIFRSKEELQLNQRINSYEETYDYLKSVGKWLVCAGTQIEDNEFCKGVIVGEETYQRNRQFPRCKSCRVLRNRLQTQNCKSRSTCLGKKSDVKLRVSRLVQKCRRLKWMPINGKKLYNQVGGKEIGYGIASSASRVHRKQTTSEYLCLSSGV